MKLLGIIWPLWLDFGLHCVLNARSCVFVCLWAHSLLVIGCLCLCLCVSPVIDWLTSLNKVWIKDHVCEIKDLRHVRRRSLNWCASEDLTVSYCVIEWKSSRLFPRFWWPKNLLPSLFGHFRCKHIGKNENCSQNIFLYMCFYS